MMQPHKIPGFFDKMLVNRIDDDDDNDAIINIDADVDNE